MKRIRKAAKMIALSLALTLTAGVVPVSANEGFLQDISETEVSVSGDDTVSVSGLYDAIDAGDFLKADGKNLRNASGTGDIVNLRGTNAGGYLLQEFWMTPTAATSNVHDQNDIMNQLSERFGEDKMYELIDLYETAYWTEQDFANCAELGMNSIRLPFWWRNLVDQNGNWYGYDAAASDPYAEAFARIDWFVETAGQYGLYVILDFHGVPGSQNGSDHSGIDGQDDKAGASEFWFGENASANQALYYEMLDVIAKRYAGNPVVAGYDLMNEPFCTYRYNNPFGKDADALHEMLWTVYDKAYHVVRAVDPDHVIIMEAVWDPGDLPNPAIYGWENVMYEYHNYLYDDYDNAGGGQISNMQSKLSSIGNSDYNVPSYMGEFCYFNQPSAWDEGLELLVNAGINWTTWTYKTIDYYGMWGIYHHPKSMDDGINLETASAEEIASWWSQVGTAQGSINTALAEQVAKWCNAAVVPNNMGPQYADIEDGVYYFLGNNSQRVLKNTGEATEHKIGAIGLAITDSDEEKFELIHNEDNTISLKSLANGKYVSVDAQDRLLRATADEITTSEKFYILQSSVTAVALKSALTQLFACVDENLTDFGEGYPVIADRASASSWETFNIYTLNHKLLGDASGDNYSGWTRYEAEDEKVATVVGSGAVIKEQDFYSGQKAAEEIANDIAIVDVAADWSNIRYVAFTVKANVAGKHKLVLSYNGDDDKSILVRVNGGDAAVVEVPAVRDDHAWNVMHQKLIEVDLTEGVNTIDISGAVGGGWLNVDCIDLINYPLTKNADGSERYEGENFYTNGAVEGQSFYSNGKGVGSLNSNTSFESVAANWSNIKYVDFTVFAEADGEYIVTWAWNGDGSDGMKAIYRVNNGENVLLTLDNAGASWDQMNSVSFKVSLEQGFNDLRISGTIENQSNWANIDFIDIVRDGAQNEVVELPKAISGWTRYEGELAAEYKNGGNLEKQDFFSNGVAIGGLSRDEIKAADILEDWSNVPYAEFEIEAAYDGVYRIVIGYNGDDDKIIALKINDEETQSISVPAVLETHDWDKMHELLLTARLQSGKNRIRITGALGGGWMNIDYLDIANAPVVINEESGIERYEAEDFDNKSANKPAREHQDFYSGAAYDNGVGGMGATYSSYAVGDAILDTKLNYIDYSIFAEKDGIYEITVAANGNGADMVCVYQLNDAPSATFELLNAGQSWDHMVYSTLKVELKKGYNRLILAGTYSGDWLNYDYIDVKRSIDDSQEPAIEEPEKPEEPVIEEPVIEEPEEPAKPDPQDGKPSGSEDLGKKIVEQVTVCIVKTVQSICKAIVGALKSIFRFF